MPNIDGRLNRLSMAALVCRAYNHAWDQVRDDGAVIATAFRGRKIVQVKEELICAKCTTKRDDLYSYPDYDELIHRYTYPENYRVLPVDGAPRLLKADVRAELRSRRRPAVIRPPMAEAA